MNSWKKIAGLFVILASVGAFAPACAVDATDAEESQDPADTTTQPEASSENLTTLNNHDFDDRDWRDRDGRDGRHGRWCESRCYHEFNACRSGYGDDRDWDRGYGRGRHCQRRLNACMDRCRYGGGRW